LRSWISTIVLCGLGYGQNAELYKLDTIGTHYLLELYGCPGQLLNDEIVVCNAMREAVRCSGADLLGDISHHFHPQGVTALGILAESHISIHTWPEHGYVAADIFTCGTRAVPRKACEYLIEAFQSDRHQMEKVIRGVESEDQIIRSSKVVSSV